ncbi:MAG: hypothetical protein JXK93_07625 [Sphaerochaetaceae bacterium]|nr:hypothetical protein [Sphaerochaetaceae bacterium]
MKHLICILLAITLIPAAMVSCASTAEAEPASMPSGSVKKVAEEQHVIIEVSGVVEVGLSRISLVSDPASKSRVTYDLVGDYAKRLDMMHGRTVIVELVIVDTVSPYRHEAVLVSIVD